MKNITLLCALLISSLGYAQIFPIDFSDPLDDMVADDCTFTLTTDAGDDVGSITGSGALYDNVQLALAENIDLSDDFNNTITFRIKPAADYGTRTHLLKFENGTAPNTELGFTTSGTAWIDISLDFPSGLGNYGLMVLFTDFNNSDIGTYLIDDFAGGINVAPPPPPAAIFPIDFETTDDTFNCFDCGFTLTTDAGDNVGQIAGGGLPFDTAQLNLAENLDLSDDTNNTITFRIKPVADYGARTHLLKFEGGSGANPTTELSFTTTGTDWQIISLDYPSGLSNYDLMVFFPDFNNTDVGTYLVDDFAGGTNITPVADPEPAPLPNSPDNETYSIYNDTNNYSTNFPFVYDFGTIGGEPDLDLGSNVNKALKFDFSFAGYGQGEGGPDDVSIYDYVHFMYWAAPGVPGFQFRLISNNGAVLEYTYEIGTDEPIVTGAWTLVTIPMSYFTNLGFSSTHLYQWKFEAFMQVVTPQGTVFVDNILMTQNPLSVDEFEVNTIKAYPNPTINNWTVKTKQIVKTVEVFDVLGKSVFIKDVNSTDFTIETVNLNSGLYFAKLSNNNSSSTIKLIKE
ncbi:T9SS type A sorting domain-containing protein [Olleya aquimaris]|uniref:Putative secreted protein (Por secretion system target) n=1 Tax=Olleya aquimaris TaxID=639310 RepID=A0A327RIP8_9FLAO|nr:T9SS type A sorting domain-containing protein [Olleya aquimaris]RAJ16421.1 putative secreted protein (Por secretion system target) [Olleya aquimaris]